MKNLKALFSAISSSAGGQSVSKAVSIPFVVHNPKDVLAQNRNYYGGTPPHVSTICLPEDIARDQITPSMFAYCKQSNSGSGSGLRTRLVDYNKLVKVMLTCDLFHIALATNTSVK